jgi:hypothetical protein
MKTILIFLTLCFSIAVARADLVMELNFDSMKLKLIVKIKRDKVRYYIGGYGYMSRIVDLKTGENLLLDDMSKRITNPPPLFGDTNAIAKIAWPKFEDTGKVEMLSGYETEIYKWTNSDDTTETLWMAKDYPNFEQIKKDLSKLDNMNDKRFLPEFNSLSGMPLKLLITYKDNRSDMLLLLSAKEESIDDSVFEAPKDYHFYSTNAPIANTNHIISATNEPPVK